MQYVQMMDNQGDVHLNMKYINLQKIWFTMIQYDTICLYGGGRQIHILGPGETSPRNDPWPWWVETAAVPNIVHIRWFERFPKISHCLFLSLPIHSYPSTDEFQLTVNFYGYSDIQIPWQKIAGEHFDQRGRLCEADGFRLCQGHWASHLHLVWNAWRWVRWGSRGNPQNSTAPLEASMGRSSTKGEVSIS